MYASLGIIACMMMVPLLFRLAATVTTTIPEDYRDLSYAASRHGLRAQMGSCVVRVRRIPRPYQNVSLKPRP